MLALLFGFVSLLYATVGQAGGTAFLALMAFAAFAPSEMRPTALLLNIVAAPIHLGYSIAAIWLIGKSFARFSSHRCQRLCSPGSSCLMSAFTTP